MISSVVVKQKDKILAFGVVNPLAELTLVQDLDVSLRERIAAIDIIAQHVEFDIVENGLDKVHVFVPDAKWSRILQRHYGFRPRIGDALVVTKGD